MTRSPPGEDTRVDHLSSGQARRDDLCPQNSYYTDG
jgi:hypothetical protein